MNESVKPIAKAQKKERTGWHSWRWLLARRTAQIGLLFIFLTGPWLGWRIVQGNFASSEWFATVNLSDPYIMLQSLLAGHMLSTSALTGAGLIILFYLLVGGRSYCSWLCPVNIVTDAALWLRDRLGIKRDRAFNKQTRLVILIASLLASVTTSVIAWEIINPVTLLQRGLIFGMGMGWTVILGIFLFDLLITRHGWCGYLCPVGAFYGIIGRFSRLRIKAVHRDACEQCGACLRKCPEPHVIGPALRGNDNSFVVSGDCINCGACIDHCPNDVFELHFRPLAWPTADHSMTEKTPR